MASYRLNNMNFSFSVRRAPKSGPTSSEKWNDTMDEISRDLTNIALEWNQKLVPVMTGLPDGSDDTTINAFVNGLDGANLWTDGDSDVDAQGGRYYNSTRARPNTVKEQFEHVYTHFANELITVQNNIISTSGLTEESKANIGANIFDSSAVSSSTSLDGRTNTNTQNTIQIATDLYGTDVELNADGNAILTNSLKAMVGALLSLHNGAWDNDVSLSHAGIIGVTQDDVATSHPGNDSYTGSPSTLKQDLNRIRSEIRELRGTSDWQADHGELYAGGPDSLEDLLVATQGSAAKSASNPWGYQYDDIAGLIAILDATNTFTRQDSYTDSAPNYGTPTYINNGDSLESALSILDQRLATQSGINDDQIAQIEALGLFVGQDNPTDTLPDYISTTFITQNSSLQDAVGTLDQAITEHSGVWQGAVDQLSALGPYTGQSTPTQSGPLYSSAFFVTQEASLTDAITQLDLALTLMSGLAVEPDPILDTLRVRWTRDNPLGTNIEDVSVAMNGNMVTVSGDMFVMDSGRGLVMYSPAGYRFRLRVDDTGSLFTTAF